MRPMLRFRVLFSLGFLLLSGAVALALPLIWATLFGLRTEDTSALAFARVAGAREIVLATTALVLWKRGIPAAATVAIGLSIMIGVADFAVVWALRGLGAVFNLAIFHAGGIILLATTWLSLRRDRS
jgi:uncharacterized protein DUF4267